MKKIILFSAAALLATTVSGKMIENPDSNTLWVEDGKEMVLSRTYTRPNNAWYDGALKVQGNPKGGFSVEFTTPKKSSTGYNVLMSKEYPWLVYKINSIEPTTGYRAFAFYSSMGQQVGNFQPGIFAIQMQNLPGNQSRKWLEITCYGIKVKFDYVKMVKTPDNYITVESAPADAKFVTVGDKIRITVHLKEKAEDVSVQFFTALYMRNLPVNGQEKIQLTPLKGDERVWSAEITVQKVTPGNPKFPIHIKATILGGNHPDALWGRMPYQFKGK